MGAVLAASSASAQVEPPESDHYIPSPSVVNDETRPFPDPPSVPGFTFDTTNFTLQDDLLNPPTAGGPPEPRTCFQGGQAFNYGKTAWAFFHAHRYGAMRLQTAGSFDSTIALVPFESLQNATPFLDAAVCTDGLASLREEFDNPQLVFKNQWYAVQVGGAARQDGSFGGGLVDLTFEFERPPKASGDAILRYTPAANGIRVSELEVKAGAISDVEVRCSRGCRTIKRRAPNGKAVAGGAGKLVPPGKRVRSAGPRAARLRAGLARAQDPRARVARTYKFLRGKSLPAGARLEVRITQRAPVIGRYFTWRIGRGAPSNKVQRCTEPYSRRPQKSCNG